MICQFCRFRPRIVNSPLVLLEFAIVVLGSLFYGCSSRNGAPKAQAALSSKPAPYGVRLESIADSAGVKYRWPEQPKPMRNLEAFGCGCAFLDYDDDGWMDILLVGNPTVKLFHNRGNGQFEDVTSATGLDAIRGDWKGVAVGDYNGDGFLDIVLTGFRRLALLRSEGGKQFADVTVQAGLDPKNHNHWGSSAAFMDLDRSGRLALLILDYVIMGPHEQQYCELIPGVRTGCPPSTYRPEFPELWQNLGNGRFLDVTRPSGLTDTHGKALVVAFADVDDDGLIDFYIGNDGVPADLMHNLGGLRFRNIGAKSGTATGETGHSIAAMGADWADYDRDGRLDLAVSAFANETYSLMHNEGNGRFSHVEDRTGIAGATLKPLGFGTKWLDVDNDGWPDLMFTNGHVYDNAELIDPLQTFREPLMLFYNVRDKYEDRERSFIDLVPMIQGDLAKPILGRGLATGDFDNDGRIDALAVDFEGQPILLHNKTETANHWITFDLREPGPNRFAYGAKVTARSNNNVWVAHVSPASSYLSSSDPRIHFGLGPVSMLDTVTIQWPDGKSEVLRGIPIDRIVRIKRGSYGEKASAIR